MTSHHTGRSSLFFKVKNWGYCVYKHHLDWITQQFQSTLLVMTRGAPYPRINQV